MRSHRFPSSFHFPSSLRFPSSFHFQSSVHCAAAAALAWACLAALPALAQGGTPSPLETGTWDLGTLDAGTTYPTTLAAHNASCPGSHDFEISVRGAPWLEITGPRVLTGVAVGETRTTAARVDLTAVEPGPLSGEVTITCLDCPPSCSQDVTSFEVRLVARAPASDAPAAAADGGGGGGSTGQGLPPGAPGERFVEFLRLSDALLAQTARDALAIQPEDSHARDVLAAYAAFLEAPRSEIRQLITAFEALPPEMRSQVDRHVVAGAPEILRTATAGSARAPKLQLQLDGEGNETAATILDKVGDVAGSFGPVGALFNALLDDVAKLFDGASEMAVMLSGMAMAEHELELKLDTLIDGIFGVSIDESSNETELRQRLREVPKGELVGRLEELERRLEEVDRRQSMTHHKVDELAREAGTTLRGVPYEVEPDGVKPPYAGPDPFRPSVLDQVELLRLKIDNLARILGLSLYGPEMGFPDGFDVEPPDPRSTVPVGGREYKAIKPEIENLERGMEKVIERLERIERRGGGGGDDGGRPGDPVDRPPPVTPPGSPCCETTTRLLRLTKKIYVYDEGTFRATGGDDREEIRVETAAFDLAGWLDLSELRDGDEVVVTVAVSVDGGPHRTWSRTVFRDAQERGLKYFTEFANGLQEVVGDDILVTLAQPRSADGWKTPVGVGYQFVVESQD